MQNIFENIDVCWPWIGVVLVIGLLAACASVTIKIIKGIQDEMDKK